MYVIEPKLRKIGFLTIILTAIFLTVGCKTYINSTKQLDIEKKQMQNEMLKPFENNPTYDEISSVNNNVGTIHERLSKL